MDPVGWVDGAKGGKGMPRFRGSLQRMVLSYMGRETRLRNGAGQSDILVQRANRTYKLARTPLGKEVVVVVIWIEALRLGLRVWEYGNNFEQQHWKLSLRRMQVLSTNGLSSRRN